MELLSKERLVAIHVLLHLLRDRISDSLTIECETRQRLHSGREYASEFIAEEERQENPSAVLNKAISTANTACAF